MASTAPWALQPPLPTPSSALLPPTTAPSCQRAIVGSAMLGLVAMGLLLLTQPAPIQTLFSSTTTQPAMVRAGALLQRGHPIPQISQDTPSLATFHADLYRPRRAAHPPLGQDAPTPQPSAAVVQWGLVGGLSAVAVVLAQWLARRPVHAASPLPVALAAVSGRRASPVPRPHCSVQLSAQVEATPGAAPGSLPAGLCEWAEVQGAVLGPIAPKANGLQVTDSVLPGTVIATIPQLACITVTDALQHPLVGELAKDQDELVAIALWTMAEGFDEDSQWAPYIRTFADPITPILWPDEQREALLTGSEALTLARDKQESAVAAWQAMQGTIAAAPDKFPPTVFNEAVFLRVLCCVLARSVYLPGAECFALVPVADLARRRCQAPDAAALAVLDYDEESTNVVLVAGSSLQKGDDVVIADALNRNSAELLVGCGYIDNEGDGDYLELEAGLVRVDPLFMQKKAIVEAAGLAASEQRFPIFRDRMPTTLFNYLRLSRVQERTDLDRLSLNSDATLSPINEYEVLNLLLLDLQDRLKQYEGDPNDDRELSMKAQLEPNSLSTEEGLAAALRYRERVILQAAVNAVMERRSAYRGVPTKGGKLEDPNADLAEVFDMFTNPVGMVVDGVKFGLGWDKEGKK